MNILTLAIFHQFQVKALLGLTTRCGTSESCSYFRIETSHPHHIQIFLLCSASGIYDTHITSVLLSVVFVTFCYGVVGRHLIQRTVQHHKRQGTYYEFPLFALAICNGQCISSVSCPVSKFQIATLAIFQWGIVKADAAIQTLIPAQCTL